jgi:ACR3 family arsenite efflux pump ArsB
MNIDFSPLREAMNHMAFQIVIIILVPLVAGFITKRILRSIKLKKNVANFVSVLVMLFVYYKTLMIVLG